MSQFALQNELTTSLPLAVIKTRIRLNLLPNSLVIMIIMIIILVVAIVVAVFGGGDDNRGFQNPFSNLKNWHH